MSIEYNIDTAEGVIYEVYKGAVSVEEAIEVSNRELADPRYQKGMPTIADLTELVVDWDYLRISQFRNYIKSIYADSNKKIKWALVAPRSAERGIINLLDILHEASDVNVDIRIFEVKDEALRWVKEG